MTIQHSTQLNTRVAKQAKLVCIVPLYNEQGNAARIFTQLYAVVKELFAEVLIVAVNDGSHDQTEQEVKTCLSTIPLRYVSLARNFGKEAALTAGLDICYQEQPDVVLIIDADFQHPLTSIEEMCGHWQNGIDMVYGVQINRQKHETVIKRGFKRLFYKLMAAFTQSSRFSIPKNAGDFRLFDKKVLQALVKLPEKGRYMKGLYAWVGFSSIGVEFSPAPRQQGESAFNYFHLFDLAVDGLTSFSIRPLRIATLAGLLIAILAFLFGLYIVFEWWFYRQPIRGFTTLASAVMFFSGIQLIFIGLLGEYIGRIFIEVKQRPVYVVAYDSKQDIAVDKPV